MQILIVTKDKDGRHNVIVDQKPNFIYEVSEDGKSMLGKDGAFADYLYKENGFDKSFGGRSIEWHTTSGIVINDGTWWSGSANKAGQGEYVAVGLMTVDDFTKKSVTWSAVEILKSELEKAEQATLDHLNEKTGKAETDISKVLAKPLSENQMRKLNDPARLRHTLLKGYRWNPYAEYPRNSDCPCGSQKKFKKCHLDKLHKTVKEEDYAELKEMVDYAKRFPNVKYNKPEPEVENV